MSLQPGSTVKLVKSLQDPSGLYQWKSSLDAYVGTVGRIQYKSSTPGYYHFKGALQCWLHGSCFEEVTFPPLRFGDRVYFDGHAGIYVDPDNPPIAPANPLDVTKTASGGVRDAFFLPDDRSLYLGKYYEPYNKVFTEDLIPDLTFLPSVPPLPAGISWPRTNKQEGVYCTCNGKKEERVAGLHMGKKFWFCLSCRKESLVNHVEPLVLPDDDCPF